MSQVVSLGAKLDTASADALLAEVTPLIGQSVVLDGSAVEHLGARCLEIILVLRHLAMRAGAAISLKAPSEALCKDLKTFGLSPADLTTGGTA